MGEQNNGARQEVAVQIIGEYKEWLQQMIEQEQAQRQQATRQIAESKQKVEQLIAGISRQA